MTARKLDVQLRREPSQAELERLNRVLRSAHVEFRRSVQAPRYAG
ncbi:hypothetical protein [Actinoplanes sp. NPDC020271]